MDPALCPWRSRLFYSETPFGSDSILRWLKLPLRLTSLTFRVGGTAATTTPKRRG